MRKSRGWELNCVQWKLVGVGVLAHLTPCALPFHLFPAGSPAGPFIPLRQSELTPPSLHPNSVCQELPCGGCNEDIRAAQLGGA